MRGRRIKIAIDGPAGAGKSTVARLVASKLEYIYVDTGAMYRAVTWYLIENGIRYTMEADVQACLASIQLDLKPSDSGQQVWVNGCEATALIRNPQVTAQVSHVAQVPAIREFLVDIQKRLSSGGGIVMDGRDIGTQVLPNAELKIFLTASVEARAHRRYMELTASGNEVDLASLQRDISARDQMDQQRAISPLVQAEDAVLIDCTSMPVDDVVERIVQLSISRINEGMTE